ATTASPRREQYYECWSNRGYYRDGWLARSLQKRGEPIDLDNWTLHDLDRDFSESVDGRDSHPDKLRELVAAFDETAWLNLVYPLDNRTMVQKMSDGAARAGAAGPAGRRFFPGSQTVHRAVVVPLISDRSFRVRATFVRRDVDQGRSEEHTSELQSRFDLVCRLLLEKKNTNQIGIKVSATCTIERCTLSVMSLAV